MPTFQVDKNKAANMQKKKIIKSFLLKQFDDKGHFASHDWNFLCQGGV